MLSYNASRGMFRFDNYNPTARLQAPDSLHWMHFDAATGNEVGRGNDFCTRPTEDEAQRWQSQAQVLAVRWGHRLDALNETLYIRFGNLPEGGRSTNYVTGKKERGVSVYVAKVDLETGAIVFDENGTDIGTLMFMIGDRTPYLVSGQEAGVGADGEPVLRKVQIVGTLRYDATLGGFVEA